MANQVTNYKCPACTGPLRFDSATGKLQCDFCGSSYEVAEIEKLYAEKDAQAAGAFRQAEEQTRYALDDMELPEVDYFLEHFLPSFKLTLDELE